MKFSFPSLTTLTILTTLTLLFAFPKPAQAETYQPIPSFTKDQDISLTFDFSKETNPQNILERFLGLFQKKVAPKVGSVRLFDASGRERTIDLKTSGKDPDQIDVSLPPLKNLKPGVYKLKAEYTKNGKTITKEQDFAWGVLALNTNKSVFTPGESAYLQMGALDKDGHTFCNAPLELQITTPSGKIDRFSTGEGTIKKSQSCGADNVTDHPDYFLYYKAAEPGKYTLKLHNTDVAIDASINDTFEVAPKVAYVVERVGATRINPFKAEYKMRLKITANEDFEGQIVEQVPSDFKIENCNLIENCKLKIENSKDDKQTLVGNIKLAKDQTITLEYTYQASKISPELFLLGPLIISSSKNLEVFREKRQWHLASDGTLTQTFNATGSWEAPAGVTSVTITARGGGAAGGPGSAAQPRRGGGGGGGGAYTACTVTVTPLSSYTVTVGATVSSGNGNSSSFPGDNGTCTANAGSVGSNFSGGAGGTAQTVGGIVTTAFAGGAGGDGVNANEGGGGGGGEGARSNATGGIGTNGSGSTGGAGGTGGDGGDGGRGGDDTGTNITGGSSPGGGGGGAGGNSDTVGSGAAGQVVLSWSTSAAISGTATSGIAEAAIVDGTKTIVITLSGDTWVAAGATFDGQRQNIINGLDSAQSEANGWDAVVKATQQVAGVERTSNTVVTITLDAFASYNITSQETITVTVPASALTGAQEITAAPTFTVDPAPQVQVNLKGGIELRGGTKLGQ